MTSVVTTEHTNDPRPRSRRAVLLGAVGALGAWAASAVARPAVTQAGVDGDVVLGADNVSAQPTSISAGAAPASARVTFLESANPGPPEERIAVHGSTQLSDLGIGIRGTAAFNGIGVQGIAEDDGTALLGYSRKGGRGGYALQTFGRIRLTGHSGIALIPAGRTSVTVQLADLGGVQPTPQVTVSPLVNLAGRSLWYTPDSKADTLTFHISSPRSTTTRLTWIMLD